MQHPRLLRRVLALSALCLVFAGTASAAPVTFNFGGSNGNFSSLPVTQSGYTATATPVLDPLGSATPTIRREGPGIGVDYTAPGPDDTDSDQLDNFGRNEAINFAMSGNSGQPFVLESITFVTDFSFADLFQDFGEEEFNLSVDGGPDINLDAFLGDDLINPGGASGPFTISLAGIPESLRTGFNFRISPDDGGDDFRIQAITATPTPEPSSMLIFGLATAGAVGCGWYRRRRAASAQ